MYELRRQTFVTGSAPPVFAPLVSGYVTVADRTLELLGVDPFAESAELASASGAAAGTPGAMDFIGAGVVRHCEHGSPSPGAVVLSATTATQLRLATGSQFEVLIGGVRHRATLAARAQNAGAGFDGLMLTDIAQAQEWLGSRGRLSRIDVRLPAADPGAVLLGRLPRAPARGPGAAGNACGGA